MTDDDEWLARRHLGFGWRALAVFSLVGIWLELLHAYKVGSYLDVGSEMRRSLWRLGHAHGALLALVNVAFACSARHLTAGAARRRASACLLVAAVLMPIGFLLGGAFATASDPGPLVALVPIGAILLVAGAWSAAQARR